jgi:hypothetical protein
MIQMIHASAPFQQKDMENAEIGMHLVLSGAMLKMVINVANKVEVVI